MLIVIAHADDLARFLGGTVARWNEAGWRVVVVRVTDDRWDSVGVGETETIEANARELRAAASLLGVHEIVELGYCTVVASARTRAHPETLGVRWEEIEASLRRLPRL